ncbi:thioesterase [Agrobacterium vitis]|uniref:Thioesterase n=1 Tax=Agrobacterium vitis TaxID=373 RepID=A0A368NNJ0_AGRVI|nr:thioesterase domain-containing protein [Agrobacterium vitis]KAA3509764.1 thioesterase [Agrobacterium vitis]KAA3523386.1 thioesterase [Agrobacterium vitis]MCF1479091.1 thioesterase [Agrobacterium vitis]MUO80247.1 thioesterase [Agrobacterium vitis]MUO97392.1 thioesterase [Agrobacterium vitis]
MTITPSRPVLLCLPPAGTGAGLFRNWVQTAPSTMTVHPVALPGREARYSEPAPRSIDALADQLAVELEPYIGGRYAIFGYSMGALLGYEIARRFLGAGLRMPEVFFALGCNAPDRMVYEREPFHTMEAAAFRQALIDLGGTDAEILNNPDAMELFEPVLRNDFRICETYTHDATRGTLDCPAHIFLSDGDAFVNRQAAAAWCDFVTGGTRLHQVAGAHMLERPVLDTLPARLATLWLETGVRNWRKSPKA